MSFRGLRGLTTVGDSAVRIAVGAAVARGDIPGLCARLAALVNAGGGGVVICEVAGRPSLVTVDALARLRLTARRHGRDLVIRGGGRELRVLLGLAGLDDVLAEAGRELEEREQPGGVEEIGDPGDPSR